MARTVTLREANQNFSKFVRAVEAGAEFVVTRRGRPVARIAPISVKRVPTPERERRWRRLKKKLEKGWNLGGWTFNRDELHER